MRYWIGDSWSSILRHSTYTFSCQHCSADWIIFNLLFLKCNFFPKKVVKLKIMLSYDNNLHLKAKVRQFTDIDIDEPHSFHGTDLGPSSVEYLLIGIGGCLSTTFIYCLQKRKIILKNLEVIIDGKLGHKNQKRKLRLLEVNVTLQYSIEENNSLKIQTCIKEFQQHCIVSNSIKEGFPINVYCTNSL
ncbi:MAG: OsmC family protein [Candidatus Thorarchaeota archaeon]